MNYEPIIKSKISQFKTNYNLENLSDNEVFEIFVNYTVLKSYQPNSYSYASELFEEICVGGQNDTGIDGIAIRVNDSFVSTKKDIDDIIEKDNRINIEFLFIQSKYTKKLDSAEFGKYMDGIVDFLRENQNEPHNSKIAEWIELKNYLCSEDVLIYWDNSPNIKIHYTYIGDWNDNEHIIAKYNSAKESIESIGLYNNVSIRYLDSYGLKKTCDDVDNRFKEVITVVDSLELNEALYVDSSKILFCKASEFLKLLLTEDNELRITLFNDNVRDYQGFTEINNEIFETIKQTPDYFSIMNNGITVVCKSTIAANRKISIENPQIVNGCQTCNTIYRAYKNGIDIDNITLIIKLIATTNSSLINSVVKGTNRQNVVYDEAFEITRDFHKDLEEFINVKQLNAIDAEKIYYERRSNQYNSNPNIKVYQKANFKVLIQSVVSVMLQCPHEGFMHESRLLNAHRNKLFIDGQSFYPYYVSILLYLKSDRLFRRNYNYYKDILTYKNQILCLFVESVLEKVPDINSRNINDYCNQLVELINNAQEFEKKINETIVLFGSIKKDWVKEKGKQYIYAIKDNPIFTRYMLTKIRGGNTSQIINDENETFRGKVITIKKDRNDLYYGFIKNYPKDVFIHEDDNPRVRFFDLLDKDVVYTITEGDRLSKYNTVRGKIKYVVTENKT